MTLDCEESFLARAIFPRISHALPPLSLSPRARRRARVACRVCVVWIFFLFSLPLLSFLSTTPPPTPFLQLRWLEWHRLHSRFCSRGWDVRLGPSTALTFARNTYSGVIRGVAVREKKERERKRENYFWRCELSLIRSSCRPPARLSYATDDGI